MAYDDFFRLSVHAVFFDDQAKVLELKQTYGNLGWGLPGGSIDAEETVIEALRRECREELGVEIEIGPLTGIYFHRRFNSQALLFRCTLPTTGTIRLSSEHSDYRYSAVADLSPIQQQRIRDCLDFKGLVATAKF